MSKKATNQPSKPAPGKRIDRESYGLDLPSVLERIRPLLAGMTHAEIAEKAGISKGNVSNVLNGSKEPSLNHLAALAKAADHGISVDIVPSYERVMAEFRFRQFLRSVCVHAARNVGPNDLGRDTEPTATLAVGTVISGYLKANPDDKPHRAALKVIADVKSNVEPGEGKITVVKRLWDSKTAE
jgi:transcriptional regulator with XRE-family HTH domain